MQKRSSSKKKDENESAFSIMKRVTGQEPMRGREKSDKNPAAVALGRLGGLRGGATSGVPPEFDPLAMRDLVGVSGL
jgi:hypothetical protein